MKQAEDLLSPGVYAIVNSVNGKLYIGSSASTFSRRWTQHRHDLRNGRHKNRYLQSAWNKHGEAAFKFKILCVTEPREAVEYEQAFIDLHKAADREFGYNLAAIAGSTLGVTHCDAAREANSQRMKQVFQRPGFLAEHTQRMQRSHNTQEFRENQSAGQKKRFEDIEERAANATRQRAAKNTPHGKRNNSLAQSKRFSCPVARRVNGDKIRAGHLRNKMRRASAMMTIINQHY